MQQAMREIENMTSGLLLEIDRLLKENRALRLKNHQLIEELRLSRKGSAVPADLGFSLSSILGDSHALPSRV